MTKGSFNTSDVDHANGSVVTGFFVGTSELNNKSDILSTIKTDKQGVLYFDFSTDNTNWETEPIEGFNILANFSSTNIRTKSNRYFRVRFENTSRELTTDFRISTYYGLYNHGEREPSGALIVKDPNLPRLTQFEELNTVQRTQIMELKSTYGLSDLRDVQTTNGGSITNVIGTNAEYQINSGTSTGFAMLETAERGRYVPGFSAQFGMGVRIPSAPSGSQFCAWGYLETNISGTTITPQNGFYFSYNSTSLYVNIANNGTVTQYAQSQWNTDRLDGTGPSGITLDPSRGNIYQVDFTWYGYGTIEFIVNVPNPYTFINEHVVVHRYRPNQETSTLNPNLPITAYSYTTTSDGEFNVYVAGRQFSIIGNYKPNRRITGEVRRVTGVDATFVPVILIRRKTTYKSVSVKFQGIDFLSSGDLIVEIRTGVTGTDGSFGTPTNTTAGETAIETNRTATTVSGGEMLWMGLVAGSNTSNRNISQTEFEFDFIGEEIVAILVKRTTGTNATVDCVVRVKEEW